MKKEHEILFEPFKIGTVMIKNRFVLEPMEGTNMIDCLPIFKIGEDIHARCCACILLKQYDEFEFHKNELSNQERHELYTWPIINLLPKD